MQQFTYGIFEAHEDEPTEVVVLGINSLPTASNVLHSLCPDVPVSAETRLIQETDIVVDGFIDWHEAICSLCVPYFKIYEDITSWPEDEWYTIADDLDLQLCSNEEDSEGNVILTADVYAVVNESTVSCKNVRIFCANELVAKKSVELFIKENL